MVVSLLIFQIKEGGKGKGGYGGEGGEGHHGEGRGVARGVGGGRLEFSVSGIFDRGVRCPGKF
jgi:hypothetical protein